MSRIIKQIYFHSAFPLYGAAADTKERWVRDISNREGKKKGAKGEMVEAKDEASEDSIGVVFVVYDRNGNRDRRS